jgi:hypothetical protein
MATRCTSVGIRWHRIPRPLHHFPAPFQPPERAHASASLHQQSRPRHLCHHGLRKSSICTTGPNADLGTPSGPVHDSTVGSIAPTSEVLLLLLVLNPRSILKSNVRKLTYVIGVTILMKKKRGSSRNNDWGTEAGLSSVTQMLLTNGFPASRLVSLPLSLNKRPLSSNSEIMPAELAPNLLAKSVANVGCSSN